MDLEHSFIIPVPPEQAWQALLDVEQVAPCMPGATVDGFDGEVISGKIKIKVGPVQMTYAGKAHFTEKDEATKTVVLEASGKETRGSGTASATIRSSLQDENGQTRVLVRTTMTVTGRPAQFGRGVMAEVGGRIIGKFATNLAAQLSGEGTPAASADEAAGAPGAAARGSAASTSAQPGGHRRCGRQQRGRGRGQRAGRRCGPAAHRGAGPAGPLVQQLAPRGRAHGWRPGRPHGEGTARHRRPRTPVDQGDQEPARRPRTGSHHPGRDRGRDATAEQRRRGWHRPRRRGQRRLARLTAGPAARRARPSRGPRLQRARLQRARLPRAPLRRPRAPAPARGSRPASVSPDTRTGTWDADAAAPDRSAANGLLPPRGSRPQDEDALDLLSVAGLPLLKRVAPAAGLLLVAAVVFRIVRRRRRASRA